MESTVYMTLEFKNKISKRFLLILRCVDEVEEKIRISSKVIILAKLWNVVSVHSVAIFESQILVTITSNSGDW